MERKWMRVLAAMMMSVVVTLGTAGCEKDGPAEEIGEKIDEAGDDIGDAAEDLKDDLKDNK